MAFAAVSVTIAGILEIFRLQNLSETGGFTQVIAGTAYNASHYSVFLQIPQFVWIGAGEVFTSITSGYSCCVLVVLFRGGSKCSCLFSG